jgi:hypothetical protein
MTNFERIKAMSIDEVAVVLERTADCSLVPKRYVCIV